MGKENMIIANISDPRELERLYREDPEAFVKDFEEAWEQKPDSEVLAAWHARLHFDEERAPLLQSSDGEESLLQSNGEREPIHQSAGEKTPLHQNLIEKASLLQSDFATMLIFAVLAGICMRLFIFFVEKELLPPINFIFCIPLFVAAYFISIKSVKRGIFLAIFLLFLISALYINLMPEGSNDAIILAYLHLPVFLWVLVGFAFVGDDWRETEKRLDFIRFNGEFCIVYAGMAICGMLLTALTGMLFGYLNIDITEFYFKNIVPFGAVALAVTSSYIVLRTFKLSKSIAPSIARIFSPLILITLIVYLVAIAWVRENPFMDRYFLISFNAVLLSVLAVTIFSISERSEEDEAGRLKGKLSDLVNFALIILALAIDSVALSAMVFRLSMYGLTPNRIAMLGINILVWANLIWVLLAYIRVIRKKAGLTAVREAVTKYLPIYGLWAAFVIFAFPWIF